jgi:quercetin dioxygenase-like cupin family protein
MQKGEAGRRAVHTPRRKGLFAEKNRNAGQRARIQSTNPLRTFYRACCEAQAMEEPMTHPAFVAAAEEGRVLNQLGHIIREKITSEQTGGAYYAFDAVSAPGLGIPPHVHSREDEVIFVSEGEFEVFLGGNLINAGPGSTLNFARGTPHGFRNIGNKPGKTLWVVTPGESFQKFFRELAQVPPGPPDFPKIAALFGKYGMDILPPPA